MFKRIFCSFILIVVFFNPLNCCASFGNALELYNNGQYEDSLNLFQNQIASSGLTGELAFNLGNCFYKLEKYGHSYLWYKKAQKYLFFDPDLKFNMDACLEKLSINDQEQNFLTDKIFFLRQYLPENFINILSVIVFGVFLFLILFRKKFIGLKIVSGFLSFYLILTCINYYLECNVYKKAVVVKKSIVYSAHSEKASILFSLPQGSIVKIDRCTNGFCKILTPKGLPGWVIDSSIGII